MAKRWSDLIVWQKSHDLVLSVYQMTREFPKEERYALCDQMKRCACSVPANIVEGHSKNSKNDFLRYLYIARGSLEELRYFVLLARDLQYIHDEMYNTYEDKIKEVSIMLNKLIKSI